MYVRPILEYSSVAWNPYLIKDIKTLESVQRRFTKRLVPGMEKLTYHQRLRLLELDDLELLHVQADLWSPYVIGQTIIFLPCDFYLLSFFFFSSPNLSGRRLDVYRTSSHGVALVRI